MYSNSQGVISDLGLRSVTDIPDKYQHIFSAYPCFNAIQSKLLDLLLLTDESLVVSAPTGAGKTVLFELAMIRLLMQAQEDMDDGFDHKIVYMAPIKALVSEKYNDWVEKFSSVGVRCLEVTGDSDFMSLVTIKDYQLILTTPEKWDSMTRRWNKTQHLEIIQQIRLFLIDEVHLLNEDRRGSTLEAVVSRMKTVQKTIVRSGSNLRFIAVSATIPNGEDLAVWLGTNEKPAKFAKIGDEMRPVKMKKVVLGFRNDEHKSPFVFDMNLSYNLKSVIMKYCSGKPTLVFCNSRKSVQITSGILVKQLKLQLSAEGQQVLDDAANKVSEHALAELLKSGIGNHHAGMSVGDKFLIEDLFRSGKLPVLIATSTLAMGVNLPAHLVVIKSTDQYVQNEMKPYTDTQLLQMIGRAGRPQYDTSAVAVIMTQQAHKSRLESLVSGQEPIESRLHGQLAELLNAEVVLKTVTDVAVALDWISSTYFYVRALKAPQRYHLPPKLNIHAFRAKLQDMCMRELNGLARYKMLEMKEGYDISPTQEGILMSKYYIRFETMKGFMQMRSDESIDGLLQLISRSAEFADVRLRVVEKRLLNSLNGNSKDGQKIRFPMKDKIKNKEMKINCLIQATLDSRQVYDVALNQEAKQIMRIASRLSKGLVGLVWSKSYFRSLISALYLSKSLHCGMWENSLAVARQLPGIGPALSTQLVMAGKTSFRSLLSANPRDLETILSRNPPFGNNLQKAIMYFPMYELQMEQLMEEPAVEVRLQIANKDSVEEFGDLEHKSALVVGVGGSVNALLHKEYISDKALILKGGEYSFKIPLDSKIDAKELEAHLISCTMVGLDVISRLKMSGCSPSLPRQKQQELQTCIDKYMKKTKRIVDIETCAKKRKVEKPHVNRQSSLSFNMNRFICRAKAAKSITELSTPSREEEQEKESEEEEEGWEPEKSPLTGDYSREEEKLNRRSTHLRGANEQATPSAALALSRGSIIDRSHHSEYGLSNSSKFGTGYHPAFVEGEDIYNSCDNKENFDLCSEISSKKERATIDQNELDQRINQDEEKTPPKSSDNVVADICNKYKGPNSIFKWTKQLPRFVQPVSGSGCQEKTSYEEKLVQGICDEAQKFSSSHENRRRLANRNMQPTWKSKSGSGSMKITNYMDGQFAGSSFRSSTSDWGTPLSRSSGVIPHLHNDDHYRRFSSSDTYETSSSGLYNFGHSRASPSLENVHETPSMENSNITSAFENQEVLLENKNHGTLGQSSSMDSKLDNDSSNESSPKVDEEAFEIKPIQNFEADDTRLDNLVQISCSKASNLSVDDCGAPNYKIFEDFKLRDSKFYPLFSGRTNALLKASERLIPSTVCNKFSETVNVSCYLNDQRPGDGRVNSKNIHYPSSKTFEASCSTPSHMTHENSSNDMLNSLKHELEDVTYDTHTSEHQSQQISRENISYHSQRLMNQLQDPNDASRSQTYSQRISCLGTSHDYLASGVPCSDDADSTVDVRAERLNASSHFGQNRRTGFSEVNSSYKSHRENVNASISRTPHINHDHSPQKDVYMDSRVHAIYSPNSRDPNHLLQDNLHPSRNWNGKPEFLQSSYKVSPEHNPMKVEDLSCGGGPDVGDVLQESQIKCKYDNTDNGLQNIFSQESCILIREVLETPHSETLLVRSGTTKVENHLSREGRLIEDDQKTYDYSDENRNGYDVGQEHHESNNFKSIVEEDIKVANLLQNTLNHESGSEDEEFMLTIDDFLQMNSAQEAANFVDPMTSLEQVGNARAEIKTSVNAYAKEDSSHVHSEHISSIFHVKTSRENTQKLQSEESQSDIPERRNISRCFVGGSAKYMKKIKSRQVEENNSIVDMKKQSTNERQNFHAIGIGKDDPEISNQDSNRLVEGHPARHKLVNTKQFPETSKMIDNSCKTSEEQRRNSKFMSAIDTSINTNSLNSKSCVTLNDRCYLGKGRAPVIHPGGNPQEVDSDHDLIECEDDFDNKPGVETPSSWRIEEHLDAYSQKQDPDRQLETSAVKILGEFKAATGDCFGDHLEEKMCGIDLRAGSGRYEESGMTRNECQILSARNRHHELLKSHSCIYGSMNCCGTSYSAPIPTGRREQVYNCCTDRHLPLQVETDCSCLTTPHHRHHHQHHIHHQHHPHYQQLSLSPADPACSCHAASYSNRHQLEEPVQCVSSCNDFGCRVESAACSHNFSARNLQLGQHQCCFALQLSQYASPNDANQSERKLHNSFSQSADRIHIPVEDVNPRADDCLASIPARASSFTASSTATSCNYCHCEDIPLEMQSLSQSQLRLSQLSNHSDSFL